MIVNKKEFTVKKADGTEVNLAVIRPNQELKHKAELEYNKAWGEYLRQGIIIEDTLWDILRKKKLWDDDKQEKLDQIDKEIAECLDQLPDDKGKVKVKGVTMKKAREAAIKLRGLRYERVGLLSQVTKHKNNTCEGLAQTDQFNFLVWQCIVDPNTKKPYFSSLQDYKERSEDPDVNEAASQFANLYYGYDPDFDKNLPENQFLLKNKMCNTDLALIDRDGDLANVDGTKFKTEEEAPVEVETFDIEDDWNT